MDAEVLGDMRDRAAAVNDEPHRALAQLIRVLSRGDRRSPSSPQDEILASRTPRNPVRLIECSRQANAAARWPGDRVGLETRESEGRVALATPARC
jgi:hypothetical protein